MKMRTEMLLISTGRSIGKRHFNRIHSTAHAAGGAAQRRSSPYRGLLLLLPQLFKTARFGHADLPPLSILAQQACHAVMAAFWFAFFIKKVQYGLMHAGLGTSVLLWRHGARAHFSAPWTAMLRCPLRPFSLCGERQYASSFPFICT